MKATYRKHILEFKRPGGTSRGVLHTKETWLLEISTDQHQAVGECGLFRGLSVDDRPDYEEKLQWVCQNIHLGPQKLIENLVEFPSIQLGVESAFAALQTGMPWLLFPSNFTEGNQGITTNGLIWMGSPEYIKAQIEEKIALGFRCIKMKIGAMDFESELAILKYLRNEFSSSDIELRVDANGAFQPQEALEKLKRLSEYQIHSIEQPIQAGQWELMAALCEHSPIDIALDEELIGILDSNQKKKLLETISAQYIILKPSLVGGFAACDQWIQWAEEKGCGWWITSALESNIGLNAIAQFTFTKNSKLPQGLGTGSLFVNNFDSPLEIRGEQLWFQPKFSQ
jgi:O-succinylbenzoate synthase